MRPIDSQCRKQQKVSWRIVFGFIILLSYVVWLFVDQEFCLAVVTSIVGLIILSFGIDW